MDDEKMMLVCRLSLGYNPRYILARYCDSRKLPRSIGERARRFSQRLGNLNQ